MNRRDNGRMDSPAAAAAIRDIAAALQRLADALDAEPQPAATPEADTEAATEPDLTEVRLPAFEKLIRERKAIRLTRLRAAVGGFVEEDGPLMTVETETVLLDIPAPATGVVRWLIADEPGDEINAGDLVAQIEPMTEDEFQRR